jgi:F-type H+-transporting ATPase subunit alpha
MQSINEAGAYDNDIEAQLKKAVEDFKRTASW